GCRRCVSACSNQVHLFCEGKHLINRKKCVQCGVCIEQCPNSIAAVNGSALHLPTVTVTVSSLLKQIEPYLRLIEKNGGITLSGGEALLQLDAIKELLQYCKQKRYHIALETSGLLSTEIYEQVTPLVDLWLFGMRVITGKKGGRHDDHIKRVLDMLVKQNAKILPRIPMVPGFFNRDDVLQSLAILLQTHALNTICLSPWNKNYSIYYDQSGIPMQMPTPTCEEIENCENKIITFFNNLNFVQYENKKFKPGNEH
ncbi:MAG: radical SAM protein, partial [Bacteroidales bacterium]